MLIQFTIENHRSIKNSAVISFAASKDTSFRENLLHPDKKKTLLPAIAIYGANAAGKSNVLHAMKTMKNMIVGDAAKLLKGQKLPWEPFGGNTDPTAFETVFMYHGVRYAYGFSFDENRIHTEYLYYWPNGREAMIFSRDHGAYEFRENVNEQTALSNRTPDNKLYLVSSNDWNLPQTENAYMWFFEKLTFLMEEEPARSETVGQILSSDTKKMRILKELMLADLGISDVSIKSISGNAPVITTTHRIIHEDGRIEHFQLRMDQESAGTQRFFARIGGWLQALDQGALLLVDEIEDSLHPLLTKRFIEMIQDQHVNVHGAQLLFTTHDAMLLNLKFFRRDQIWFAEKDDKTCATELYSLASFSPRKGEDVRKGYLRGRFGAVPFIGGLQDRLLQSML